MKKYLLGWMTIFMMAVCVGFTACGSDDDGGGGDSGLVGTWVNSRTYTSGSVTYLQSQSITFNSNHTGVVILSEKAVSGTSSTSRDYVDTFDFTWSASDNRVYITIKNNSSYSGSSFETVTATYVISGKTLALTFESESSYSGSSSTYTTVYERQ